jgi:flavodoxin
MRAVVVYESMFGDTRQVAEAIGDGLGLKFEVTVVAVDRLTTDQLRGIDLLVVGGPTHVRG